jgi:hypothetical protein
VTNAAAPSGAKAIPKGFVARGSAMVCTTARVPALITDMLESPLLTTQIRPSGATATDLGAEPTAISPSLASEAPSNTLMLSLS